jgi:hypothetical protein
MNFQAKNGKMRQIVWRIFSLPFGEKVVSLPRKRKN